MSNETKISSGKVVSFRYTLSDSEGTVLDRSGDEAMPYLAQFPKLTTLSIEGADVTDEGILALAKSKTLDKVYARLTLISEEGVEGLKQANPKIAVEWDE